MNDQELFDLCKDVVTRTEWGGTDYLYCSGVIMNRRSMDDDDLLGEVIPLYTSDYLLEKLPRDNDKFDEPCILAVTQHTDNHWMASYLPFMSDWFPQAKIAEIADTPLKALLKLTIALHKNGELNQ